MKKRTFLFWIFSTLVLMGIAFGGSSTYALEEYLRLRGVVKSVDPVTGIAVVDVNNDGCAGERTFRVDDVILLTDLQGQEISFYIDSSKCADKEVYKIVLSRGWRK